MDAIRMLKDDHQAVERLFKRFERAGERAYTEKREVVDRIVGELSRHAAVEEQVFYPVVRATVPGTEDIALESLEAHHVVEWVLSEIDGMDPEHERFDAKVAVLIDNVRHHVEEEEQQLFPKVREELGRNALGDLGEAMAKARQLAPTHPHPRSPDTPPGNLVAGAAAGMVDRIGDTVSGVAHGGVSAINDLVAKVRGRKRSTPSPRGSATARKASGRVRALAHEATDKVVEAVTDAKQATTRSATKATRTTRSTATSARRGARSTAKAASSGAKSTARTAKRATKRTAGTAKRTAKRAAR